MGSGASKLEHPKGEMLPKLPPVFGRKLEEIRRRRAGTTLSKKQLLKDGYEDDCVSAHHTNDRKSVSSAERDDEDSIRFAKVAQEPTEPEEVFSDDQEVIAQEKSTERDNKKDNDNADEDKEEKVEEAVITTMEKLALEETEDEQEDDEYGRFSNVEGSLTCPASPSFRIYYIESQHDKEDDGKDEYMNKGSLSDTDVDIAEIVESGKSTQETAAKMKKRGRKMKFRRVIPTGKPVKKFLSVKSCYYPSCGCGGLQTTRLTAAKAATT